MCLIDLFLTFAPYIPTLLELRANAFDMLLVLSDAEKEHLNLLVDVGEEVAAEFCRIAIEFLKYGINEKKYNAASSKLNLDAILIRQAVESLMNLFMESSKLAINEIDFQDSIISLALPEVLNKCLLKFYLDNRLEIRRILDDVGIILPHYEHLEWRFDVKVASRFLEYQTRPEVLLRFHINHGDRVEAVCLQADPVNLVHLTRVLEEALAELKTAHCRRITRNIK